jgi:hypothetical protein
MKFNHKCLKILKLSIIIITCLICFSQSLRFRLSKDETDLLSSAESLLASKKNVDDISDKELESLLKDPKYAAIAGDLMKPTGGSSASISTASSSKLDDIGSLSSLSDSSLGDAKSLGESSSKHKSSSLSKGRFDAKSSKEDPLSKIELLSKSLGTSDPLKDLDILGGGFDSSRTSEKKKEKKNEEEEKFKNIEFITKPQARFLIEVLKQPAFFSMLPSEAQQIVNVCLI